MLRRSAAHLLNNFRATTAGNSVVFLLDNQIGKIGQAIGNISTKSGVRHPAKDVASSLQYIEKVHREYVAENGGSGFHGRIAEVGPGDNCGVGLLMLADGARHVDLVDRFFSRRNDQDQAPIYAALIERRPELERFRGIDREEDFTGIVRRYGESASAEQHFLDNRDYDFIVSRAVMEHVREPILALRRMRDALVPGGMLMHEIDLRDHGMFSSRGFHELKFLELPPGIYREMTAARGRPNRVPLSAYQDALPGCEIKITRLVGGQDISPPARYAEIPLARRQAALDEVRRRRDRFHARFARESDEDLSVAAFFLIYRAP